MRDGAAAGLVADIDKAVAARKSKGLCAFVVFMGGPEMKESVEKVAKEHKTTIPLTLLPQGTGARDIGAYKINPEAQTTVLLWKGQRVVSNFVDADAKSVPAIEKALDELLK